MNILNYFALFVICALGLVSAINFQDALATSSLRFKAIQNLDAPIGRFASAARYSALADATIRLQTPNLDLAAEATTQSIIRHPKRIENWHRRTYTLSLQNKGVSQTVHAALEQALFLSPFGDADVMKWRLEFANTYWDKLDNSLKLAIARQIIALDEMRTHKDWLEEFSQTAHPDLQNRILRALDNK